jgi:hypothetical protein
MTTPLGDYLSTASVWEVLGLIVAEFKSDPTSVQCFDLRLVARACELVAQHDEGGTRQFLIWSIEHDAWWKRGWLGYTRDVAEAGRYTEADADHIIARANLITVNECKVPLAAVERS